MSDPQRYSLSEPDISYGMDEDSKGEYVLWKDYARLKAEVERLRKAGDAVCESPYLLETDRAVIAWRAAKEGKQP